ncbi:hypothetical protein Scep_020741 [Stephania cephalantha]|uniref:HTH myb-type domain-containing protein n=1 Tax=Stephania cephalantha TaxID=152367 RepID=A0AAP0IEG0_9MAGN
MGSVSQELSLVVDQDWSPKLMIGGFLREVSMIRNPNKKRSKLDEYVFRLEEELRKIEMFKRELPLSMVLVEEAIAALKEKSMCFGGTSEAPIVTEDFICLKRNSDDEDGGVVDFMEEDCGDKKNWMSSAQLWSCNNGCSNNQVEQKSPELEERVEEDRRSGTDNPFGLAKRRSGEGAFVPFKRISSSSAVPAATKKISIDAQSVPSLSLITPPIKYHSIEPCNAGSNLKSKDGIRVAPFSSSAKIKPFLQNPVQQHQPQQPQKKQRRSWSTELHKRFVSVLLELGGPQVATPKQIRDLMKVDGLTNDEVKSHLQKYRLHNRRQPNASTSMNPPVVLGDLWASQDQCGNSKESTSSGSPQGPLELASKGVSSTGGNSMEEEEEEGEISKSHE